MAPDTSEALILTSEIIICMYPLLGLVHHTYHDFGNTFSDNLDVNIAVESAVAKELVPERWPGDSRCFSIRQGDWSNSGCKWTLKVCKGTNTQYIGRQGIISSSWKSLSSMIASLESLDC